MISASFALESRHWNRKSSLGHEARDKLAQRNCSLELQTLTKEKAQRNSSYRDLRRFRQAKATRVNSSPSGQRWTDSTPASPAHYITKPALLHRVRCSSESMSGLGWVGLGFFESGTMSGNSSFLTYHYSSCFCSSLEVIVSTDKSKAGIMREEKKSSFFTVPA